MLSRMNEVGRQLGLIGEASWGFFGSFFRFLQTLRFLVCVLELDEKSFSS